MTYYVGTIPCGSDGLSHFGIKGMKWGVRRTPEQLGHKKEAQRIKRPQAHSIDRKKKINIDPNMSDDELRSRINRLKLEEEYKRLLYKEPEQTKKADKGKSKVKGFLTEIGKEAVKGFFATAAEAMKDTNYDEPKKEKKEKPEYQGRHEKGIGQGKHSPGYLTRRISSQERRVKQYGYDMLAVGNQATSSIGEDYVSQQTTGRHRRMDRYKTSGSIQQSAFRTVKVVNGMTYYIGNMPFGGDDVRHFGVKGMRWGVRRYQNEDGSLTAAGRARYGLENGGKGNDRLARLYDRQTRKLNRLNDRADVSKQAERSRKLGNVAKTAAGIGVGAIGSSLGLKGINQKLKIKALSERQGLIDQSEDLMRTADENIRSLWRADKKAYDSNGNWTGKGYSKETNDMVDAVVNQYNAVDNKLMDQRRKIGEAYNAGARRREIASRATAAIGAASLGVAAVTAISSRVAKHRTTELGHQKAVRNAQKQLAKMEKMFANTPYSDLVKKQSKGVKLG